MTTASMLMVTAIVAAMAFACGGTTSATADAPAGPPAGDPDDAASPDAMTSDGDIRPVHHHATDDSAGPPGQDHHGHMEHRFTDVEAYAARWNDPARDAWQQPAAVVASMGIEPGMVVADLGAGTGYFVPHLADAVGPDGAVLAVDIEQAMLDYIEGLAEEHALGNVTLVLAEMDDPRLEAGGVDRILTVNTWHHIAERRAYGVHLREALRPGGSVWVVDFHEASTHGPPAHHRIPAHVVVEELEAAGLEAEVFPLELERQYVVVGRRPAE